MARRSRWLIVAACLAVLFAGAAAAGWYEAIQRGNARASTEVALAVEKQQNQTLQTQLATLQDSLTKARDSEQALRSQKLDAQASLEQQGARSETMDALRSRAETLDARVSNLQAALAQARQATANGQAAPVSPNPSPNPSPSAGALPEPDLPAGSTSRDFLVAAQSAIREDKLDVARAALGRAQVRLLNRLSQAGELPPVGTHPEVEGIGRTLNALGKGDKQAALTRIDELLATGSAGP